MRNCTALSTLILSLISFALVGCGKDSHEVISMTISPEAATMTQLGQTLQFVAQAQLDHTAGMRDMTNAVTWSSSNPSVVRINGSGVATAVGCGSTMIRAQATAAGAETQLSSACSVPPTGV